VARRFATGRKEFAVGVKGDAQMIGSRVLVFLDSGPDFLRSVKTAALYSEQVHVLTLLDSTMLGLIEADAAKVVAKSSQKHPRLLAPLRTLAYAEFMRENGDELRLLEQERALSSFSRLDNWHVS
jgi:hypothetical protein